MHVRAAVLRSVPGPLTIECVTVGEPEFHEVLVRTRAAGVCHSDLNAVRKRLDVSASADMNSRVTGAVEASPFRLPPAPLESDLVAKYFRGLGDPSRVRILGLLREEGEVTVGGLVHRLELPQPKVSNHLACLRWCGFIEARREGRVVYNRIADDRVVAMLELAESLLADNAEHVAACCRIEAAQ
jgi:ArsR family transcriptional regulator